jgi:hypothetical protein
MPGVGRKKKRTRNIIICGIGEKGGRQKEVGKLQNGGLNGNNSENGFHLSNKGGVPVPTEEDVNLVNELTGEPEDCTQRLQ